MALDWGGKNRDKCSVALAGRIAAPAVLLQCMKVKSEREVAQLCPTLSDPMDCSPPGSSIHGIFQARVLEWAAIVFSEESIGRLN